MGPVGSQLEAAFALRASVPAGNYHVVCDAIVTGPVDVTFTLIHRGGGVDTSIAQWSRHWDPVPGQLAKAQPYELDVAAPAIEFRRGDQLVFRYAGAGTTSPSSEPFIPNGDGQTADGRIPNITLPR